ncbi:MAG: manganese efflux pump [Oscillospiraceae bacterium]|nr:manganese efflux pump [Oscillospiraceae bacterium]
MHFTELLLLSVGLGTDACAVSMTNGMCGRRLRGGWILADGLVFGLMQGAMPLLGYLLGSMFSGVICAFDHFIALVLLCVIGGKQVFEALHPDADAQNERLTVPLLLLQGIATSIDALAVGVSFSAFSGFRILPAISLIAAVTAVMSFSGVLIGRRFGAWLAGRAQLAGGLLLIAIGVRIFLSHLRIL